MTAAAVLPRPARRVLYGLLGLALSAGWLVAAALPAAGAQDWGVQSPGPGQVVDGAFIIEAYVVTFADQRVDQVRYQFRRDAHVVGGGILEPQGGSQTAPLPGQTRTTWQGRGDVSGLPNGTYVVEVSVVNAMYPEGSPWRGHEFVVDVLPTASLEVVRVADAAARKVEVRWARSTAPDHVRYVVERAGPEGGFAEVRSIDTSDTTVHLDIVPEYGDYRYRVKVVRMAADGTEHEAVSEPRSISVQPDSSGRPESGGEPDGPLGERTEPPAGDPAGEAAPGPATNTPRLSATSPSGSSPSTTSARSQRPNVAPPPNPNTTFEERLDYGVPLPEWEGEEDPDVLADAGGSADGGTLTVFGDQDIDAGQALKPVAGGLVLTLFGLHIVRFLRTES